MKKNMIKLFSTVTKNERNVWNNMFSNFLKGNKFESKLSNYLLVAVLQA